MNRFELADAMIKGLKAPGVIESNAHYLSIDATRHKTFCKACALGLALIGHYDGDYIQAQQAFRGITKGTCDAFADLLKISSYLADLLEISSYLAAEIEYKHIEGMPIEQIAAWLKSEKMEVKANV